ncbi:MAG: HK97-gp10 family putative phage morphogenesis protein, partial [bacterium]
MAEVFSFELVGLEQLLKNMEELPTVAMKKTVVRNALKKSLKPVLEAAKQSAPKGETGALAKSIKIGKLKPSQRKGKPRDRTTVTAYVGSTSPIAHLIEFGTQERTLSSPVAAPIGGGVVMIHSTGRISANPFLRNA